MQLPGCPVFLVIRGLLVDLALAVAVAITARLVTLLAGWLHERHRSARAYEMARRLPQGSRYVENSAYMAIEIGRQSRKQG